MMEILEAYQDLLHAIDTSILKKDVESTLRQIKEDQKLMTMLEEYRKFPSLALEKEIYQNKHYQDFKKLETETNLLIMQINFKFKQMKQVITNAHC